MSNIFSRPRSVILFIGAWWAFWSSFAYFFDTGLISPTRVYLLSILFSTFLICSSFFISKKIENAEIEKKFRIKNFIYLIWMSYGLYFLLAKSFPVMIADPLSYRLSTFNDVASGIESTIFSSSMHEFVFNLFYLQIPLVIVLISSAGKNKTLFLQAMGLLLIYSAVRMWRGGVYIGVLFYFMAGFFSFRDLGSIKKIFLLFAILLIFLNNWFRNEVITYHVVGFSLLENLLDTLDPERSDRFFTFTIIFGSFASLIRIFDSAFLFDYEKFSSGFSSFVDIGVYDTRAYNAYYTFLVGPLYDYGYVAPVVLSFLLVFAASIFARMKLQPLLKSSVYSLIFYIGVFGVFQNTIADRLIFSFIVVVALINSRLFGVVFKSSVMPAKGRVGS